MFSIRNFFYTEIGAACERQLHYIPKTVFLATLVILSYICICDHRTDLKETLRGFFKNRWLVLFLFYASYIAVGAIFGRVTVKNPLEFVFDHFGFRNDPEWDSEIIINIVLFIPYVFFFLKSYVFTKPALAALKLAFGTTVFIEVFQLFFCLGSFQFADIFHNTLGGMIGCVLWYAAEILQKK